MRSRCIVAGLVVALMAPLAGGVGLGPEPEHPMDLAARILTDRARAANPGLAPWVAQEHRNLAAAKQLGTILDTPADAAAMGADLAAVATAWQRATFGLPPATGAIVPHELPSAAARAWLQARDAPSDEARLRALDDQPPALRTALAALLDAAAAFDGAGRAYAGGGIPTPVQLAEVLQARGALLAASLALAAVLPGDQACGSLLPPEAGIVIDLGACDDVYPADLVFSLDAGGDDVYLNNAGGGSLRAAMAIDFGGNDRYASGRSGGINGAGAAGAGFLLDLAGNDLYEAGGDGVNGGGTFGGAGFLLDLAGDDTYLAQGGFGNGDANGAAEFGGLGLLIDLAGNDRYDAQGETVNGGGETGGAGFLLDAAGDDVYVTYMGYGNGGCGYNAGAAFLLEGAGDDLYLGSYAGVNGGAFGCPSFLEDRAGDDRYLVAGAPWPGYEGLVDGGNGGAVGTGVGFLLDEGGDDLYQGGSHGINGGADGPSLGILLDLAGNDRYFADSWGANGGGVRGGSGTLEDFGGDDVYVAGSRGANGGASEGPFCLLSSPCPAVKAATGWLLDHHGHDVYDDREGGAGQDVTVAPKGLAGAQVDLA